MIGERVRSVEPGVAIFVGEGDDECRLLSHLTSDWDPPPFIDRVKNIRGVSPNDHFRALTLQAWKGHAFSIGLLVDAESSRKKAQAEVEQMFNHANLRFPKNVNAVVTNKQGKDRLRVAYLINPPRCESGSIETLFVRQIMSSGISDCLKDLLRCYQKKRIISSSAQSRARSHKILVRSYLACKKSYNTGLGPALEDKVLICNGPEFDAVKRFVSLLKPPAAPLFDPQTHSS